MNDVARYSKPNTSSSDFLLNDLNLFEAALSALAAKGNKRASELKGSYWVRKTWSERTIQMSAVNNNYYTRKFCEEVRNEYRVQFTIARLS